MSRIIKPHGGEKSAVSEFERSDQEEIGDGNNGAAHDPAAILATAREQAEKTLEKAYEEGLRKGLEAARDQFRDAVGESAQMLTSAAESLATARQEFLDEIEPQVVHLATSIASKIIGQEVQIAPELIKKTTRSVLERVMDEERVVLHVNPKDINTLREHRADLLRDFEGIGKLDLVPDETIDSGGCIAVTEHLRVDGRLASQLEQIINELMD